MKEKWKPIPIKEFSDKYMVSNFGKVKSIPHYVKGRWGQPTLYKGKMLKGELRKGYLSVQLYSEKTKKKHFNIHRLVALAFVSHINAKIALDTDSGNHVEASDYESAYVLIKVYDE